MAWLGVLRERNKSSQSSIQVGFQVQGGESSAQAEMSIHHVLSALLCASCQALVLTPSSRRAAPVAVRSRAPAAAPAMLFDLFGGDKKEAQAKGKLNVDAILRKDPETWTSEEKRAVADAGSNWAAERKPNQQGYEFFQGPTPKTGVQEDLPDFFSADNAADIQIPPQLALFGGTAVVGALALVGFVALS